MAGEEAEKGREQIGGHLDEDYVPVYAGIANPMDFHYSLAGDWLELDSAAMGNLGSAPRKHLFDGFDMRSGAVSLQRFRTALDEAIAFEAGGAEAFWPVVTRVL